MIAILTVELPYKLLVAANAPYRFVEYEDSGFQVAIQKPRSSGRSHKYLFVVNNAPAFVADQLLIAFRKDDFRRPDITDLSEIKAIDPPVEVIERALSSFTQRVRYTTNSAEVSPLPFPFEISWKLNYIHEDGRPVEAAPGAVSDYVGTAEKFQAINFDPALLEQVNTLPAHFRIPEWRKLLIDARGVLPHVGAALTLAAAGLEVFIAEVLNLAQKNSCLPDSAWQWLNSRKPEHLRPSVEEQFDAVLKIVCGHSLKEVPLLWEKAAHLRTARNKFVHEGVPRAGGIIVDPRLAEELIGHAEQVTATIREWLPSELQWPIFPSRPLNYRYAKLPEPG